MALGCQAQPEEEVRHKGVGGGHHGRAPRGGDVRTDPQLQIRPAGAASERGCGASSVVGGLCAGPEDGVQAGEAGLEGGGGEGGQLH